MKNTSKTSISAEQTQERLVKEGIRLFALYGISGLRTRQLAEDAGVNQSAIPYHFGGKLGVYTAVIKYITSELAAEIHFERFDSQFQSLLKDKGLKTDIISTLIPLLVTGLCRALLTPERSYYSQLILREQLEPTENYEFIYSHLIEPFHLRLSSVIALVDETGSELTKSELTESELTTTVRAHAIIGQVLGFMIARKAFLLRINAANISDALLEEIAQEISRLSISALLG